MRHPIDPKVDCVFKALLGAESNRDLLIHFLNAVLGAASVKNPATARSARSAVRTADPTGHGVTVAVRTVRGRPGTMIKALGAELPRPITAVEILQSL